MGVRIYCFETLLESYENPSYVVARSLSGWAAAARSVFGTSFGVDYSAAIGAVIL